MCIDSPIALYNLVPEYYASQPEPRDLLPAKPNSHPTSLQQKVQNTLLGVRIESYGGQRYLDF